MLVEVQASNPLRTDLSVLSLPLFGLSRYPIVFIDGLGPAKSEHSSTPYANLPGEYHQNSRVGLRNIVLTLDLEPNYGQDEDPEVLREELYGYFAPGTRVELTFITDRVTRYISAEVETFEPPLFAEKPQVQISMNCYDPFFRPGSNVSFDETIPNAGVLPITNNGKVSVGFTATVQTSAPGTEFILSLSPSQGRPLQINYAFPTNSTIYIDTRPRMKNVTVETNDGTTSLLPYIVHGSGWPTIPSGNSDLSVRMTDGSGNNLIVVEFEERFIGL